MGSANLAPLLKQEALATSKLALAVLSW